MDRYNDMSVLILPVVRYPGDRYFKLPEEIKEDYIFLPLILDCETDAHANMIFLNNVKKTVHRYEPHGGNSPAEFDL